MPHREPRSASNEARLISALPMQDTPTPQAFYQALCPWNHYVLYVQYTEAHIYNQQRDYGDFQGSISVPSRAAQIDPSGTYLEALAGEAEGGGGARDGRKQSLLHALHGQYPTASVRTAN